MPVKINGATSGSVTLAAPASGNDVTLTVPVTGFGKVLQVVYASTTTATTVASTSYADTTLTATITPSATTSRVLVIASQTCQMSRSSSLIYTSLKLVRGASDLLTLTDAFGIQATGATVVAHSFSGAISYVDSPSSTSALTYKVQGCVNTTANSGQAIFQASSIPSTIILVEVAA